MSDEPEIVGTEPITDDFANLEEWKTVPLFFDIEGTPTAFVTRDFHYAFVGEMQARWKRLGELAGV